MFPPHICNAIGEYGGCCEKCTEMKLNEKEFLKKQKNSNLDKFEVQIHFFYDTSLQQNAN